MTPDLTITRASNGWVLEHAGFSEDDPVTVIERDPGVSSAIQGVSLLLAIVDILDLDHGNRHAAQRLFVGVRPGDKHHDLHPQPCADCECDCDPDRSDASVEAAG